MKAKTKQPANKSTKTLSGVSRVTQKTFVLVAALAYATYSFMMIHDTIEMLTSGYTFDMSPFLVYAIPATVLPLLAFVILYVLSSKKSSKLWRAFQAALLSMFVVLAYGVIISINDAVFQNALGYGTIAAGSNAVWLQLIPPVLAILLAVGLGMWLKPREKTVNNISPKALKVLMISLLSLIFAQLVVSFFIQPYGTGLAPSFDTGTLAIAFMGFAIPVIAIGILYFITSKLRPRVQRVFIATIYAFIGVLVTMAVASLSFQIAPMIGSGMVGDILSSMSGWGGLIVFVAIVIWHKIINAL